MDFDVNMPGNKQEQSPCQLSIFVGAEEWATVQYSEFLGVHSRVCSTNVCL